MAKVDVKAKVDKYAVAKSKREIKEINREIVNDPAAGNLTYIEELELRIARDSAALRVLKAEQTTE